jgi:hypothetical protein
MTYDFQIIGDHPHAGKRVKLVEGTTPEHVQGITVGGMFMALCEDEDGQRYYAKRSDLAQVRLEPLERKRKRR